ncbi:MAG TPA: hypothetical protein PKW90_29640, partial [Myxococcota bacterium]|nr:hypothetical protein [Myxococcota bacterium]
MSHTPATPRAPTSSSWIVLALGAFFLVLAVVVDPIGASPDSGLLDLGRTGTRGLIGLFGGVLLVGGLV